MADNFIKSVCVVIAFIFAIQLFGQQQAVQQGVLNQVNASQQVQPLQTPNSGATLINQPGTPVTMLLKPKINMQRGSFRVNVAKDKRTKAAVAKELNAWFNLNSNHTFKQVYEKTDELGITHTHHQQYYKGIRVEGAKVNVSSRQGIVTNVIGKINDIEVANMQISISADKAKAIAKAYLNVTTTTAEYPVDTVITRINKDSTFESRLALIVRIDSNSPFTLCDIYIDASTGQVINRISLIANADVQGTANTFYRGVQPITCDSYSEGYRLIDNARKIETYDASLASDKLTVPTTTGMVNVTSKTTTFTSQPVLNSFIITSYAGWRPIFDLDGDPDFYIKVKDGANVVVYTSSVISKKPSIADPTVFDGINIALTNPPYSVEILDQDVTQDQSVGSCSIDNQASSKTLTVNGNNCQYNILQKNPAIDVHWALEKAYDYYLNVFNRRSYDGKGSVIKSYINSREVQSRYKGDVNNAFAGSPPYNCLTFGLGDGFVCNPFVSLDFVSHEFTHLVVCNSVFENGQPVGFVYQGESGALHESFADIFGTCVEFYAVLNPNWTMGENVTVKTPFSRSLSNPKASSQPNTYKKEFWVNTADTNNDKGGVHNNAGVHNYWFYLLCQGGSGTNDLGNNYSVTGIGINDAQKIVYRNLTTYLISKNSNYGDVEYGSLQSVIDLFGEDSPQYMAVQQAWYAVGIRDNPGTTPFCLGSSTTTALTGTISDGISTGTYANGCFSSWLIQPSNGKPVILSFSVFDTEQGYDWVTIYDGTNSSAPVLGKFSGKSLPPTIKSSGGSMYIEFNTNETVSGSGFKASYINSATPTNYTINFTASGLSNTFTKVEVQNLTKGTKVLVPAGYVLNLVTGGVDTPILTTELNTTTTSADNALCIYPNPTHSQATVSFATKEAGTTKLTVFAIDGRKVLELNKELPAGHNAFSLSLPKGIYVIHVNGKGYTHTARLISLADNSVMPEITATEATFVNTLSPTPQKVEAATTGVITMNYIAGDQLCYKATSGSYNAVVNDIPMVSKTTNFYFSNTVTDIDGNTYNTITIGTQTWMIENLKTSHYRNGDAIPNELGDWSVLTTGAWCNYNNDAALGAKYGKLYNWFAVDDTRGLAPVGWHVPTHAEWSTLETYVAAHLGSSPSVAKALAATTDWYSYSGTTDAIGKIGNDLTKNNSSLFGALPGGLRGSSGFSNLGYNGYWWSATVDNNGNAMIRYLYYYYTLVYTSGRGKYYGYSVRCVKD